jgi:peptide deformylase
MREILNRDAAVLREVAKPVDPQDIGSKKLNAIIADMKAALTSQDDGVAIAAPQIGVSLRIFVVAGKAFAFARGEDSPGPEQDMVFINPKIVKRSRDKEYMDEGCLSVRYLYGKVKRSVKVTLEALDESGNPIERGASGLMAQIFQHETDHLDGILFTDTAIEVEDIPPEVVAERSRMQTTKG